MSQRNKARWPIQQEKGTITNETCHTITISNKKRQPTTYSKRDVAMPNEPQSSTIKQTTRKLKYKQSPVGTPEPTKNAKPNKMAKPIKTAGPKKRSKLPKEFQRLTNWEQLANDSTDKEEENKRQKAAVKAQKAAVKATVISEKPTKTKPDSDEEETTSQQSTERPKRDRKTPNCFGNPVMICDIEQKPEFITTSSSTEEN